MRRANDKSFWELVRAGKLDESDHDATGYFGGRHAGVSRLMQNAMRLRAGWILRGFGHKPHRAPVIVKQVSIARQTEALRRIARYIARTGVRYEKEDKTASGRGDPVGDLARAGDKKSPRARGHSKVTQQAAESEQSPPIVFDQDGNEIARSQAVELLEQWGLLHDREHLSPRASEALRKGGQKALNDIPEEDAFEEVQGRHIVISIPDEPNPSKTDFEQVVREFVKRTFGAWDYPAIAAVHLEHGRKLHGHILVGTSNLKTLDLEELGGRLIRNANHERFFFDYDGIVADGLRAALAEVATGFGIDVDASRREDRPELVWDILEGNKEIRPSPTRKPKGREPDIKQAEDLPAIFQRLVRRAPKFVASKAETLVGNFVVDELRRAEMRKPLAPTAEPAPFQLTPLLDKSSPKPIPDQVSELPPVELSEAQEQIRELTDYLKLRRVFVDEDGRDCSDHAVSMWIELGRENPSIAKWTLMNTPYLFGPITAESSKLPTDREFVSLLREIELSEAAKSDPILSSIEIKEAKRVAVDVAIIKLREIFGRHAEAPWFNKFALEGQKKIVRSYIHLADAIEEAFPDDIGMLEDAVALRDRASIINGLKSVPIKDLQRSEISDHIEVEKARHVRVQKSRGRNDGPVLD